MGDVAMCVPVLRAFSNQYPEVEITVLTRKFFTPFFRDLKNVQIHSADVKGNHKGVFGLYKLSKELKTLNIDAVADLHHVLRSHVLKFFLSGIKTIQIDKGREEKKALVSGQDVKSLKTTHQRYVEVFEKLGFPVNLSNPEFPMPYGLNDKILKIIPLNNKDWIGIAPFAAHKGKMYPLELMEEVILKLSKTYKVLLFGGGKEEKSILNTFQEKYDNVINLAGKLSLSEELDVISNLTVMLSMDSGNAHIAAMMGVDVISIWGVTHPYAGFTPFNQPKDYSLLANRDQYPKIPTSIYGNKYPEGYENASSTISPELIIKKIETVVVEFYEMDQTSS